MKLAVFAARVCAAAKLGKNVGVVLIATAVAVSFVAGLFAGEKPLLATFAMLSVSAVLAIVGQLVVTLSKVLDTAAHDVHNGLNGEHR